MARTATPIAIADPDPHRRRSDIQAAQVLIAPPDTGQGILGFVMLDEVVPDAGLRAAGEDRLPPDAPRAHVHHAVLRGAAGVLDVHHGEAARPAREVR